MGDLSFLEYEALRDRALRWGREIATDIKQHITAEREQLMSDIQSSLDALGVAIQTELQQVRDAVNAAQEAIGDKAAVEAALADAQSALDAADSRVQGFTGDLASDDAPVEPEPTEPTP